MALPTDANIELVLCDSARAKPDGKLDITGYYPFPSVKLDPSAPLPAAINLTFLFVIKDGDGQFRGRFRILDPHGGELHRYEIREFTKQPGLPHLVILTVNRIPIVSSGDFCALLEIEGQEYRRMVQIFQ